MRDIRIYSFDTTKRNFIELICTIIIKYEICGTLFYQTVPLTPFYPYIKLIFGRIVKIDCADYAAVVNQ